MKVLCVIDSLGPGGAQRQLVGLALGFQEKGLNVTFLTYHHLPFYNSILENSGISINCIQENNYLRRLIKMRRFIYGGKFDAVLAFLEAPCFICEVAGFPFRSWKLVVGERSANPAIMESIKLKAYRGFHLLADYVVANSYANMRLVKQINPMLRVSRCKVLYNSIDFETWKPDENYVLCKNRKLKLIVAAEHRHEKNLRGLLAALLLLNETERSRLNIEWYGDEVDTSLQEAKKIVETNHLDNVISFFPASIEIIRKTQQADVVCLFSFYEGLPNTVCEGMACGKPIISSAVSDLPELLKHQNKLLCNPSDPRSIRDAILLVLNSSNKELIKIGRQNRIVAENNFNKETIITQYLRLLS